VKNLPIPPETVARFIGDVSQNALDELLHQCDLDLVPMPCPRLAEKISEALMLASLMATTLLPSFMRSATPAELENFTKWCFDIQDYSRKNKGGVL